MIHFPEMILINIIVDIFKWLSLVEIKVSDAKMNLNSVFMFLRLVFLLLTYLGLMSATLVAFGLCGRERQTPKQIETTDTDKTT